MGGQVVDTVTAEEFMQQVLLKISVEEMEAIVVAAETKADRFRSLFNGGVPSRDTLEAAFKMMFGVRRRKGTVLIDSVGADHLGGAVAGLLSPGPVPQRLDDFVAALPGHDEIATEIGAEILHFTSPEEHWLWTRWMWDPRTETGALRLVTMDDFDLAGATAGATYVRVGLAMAFVAETGRAIGFAGRPPFGLDVFLACVYGIYMYTVLRMRMTQEFNSVVPQLPELARRLLGVHRLEA